MIGTPKRIRETDIYARWFDNLRDQRAKAKIDIRIRRLSLGNPGDAKALGGISYLRIDHGPGYRIYFTARGSEIVLLLVGDDKTSQQRDIAPAQELAANWSLE